MNWSLPSASGAASGDSVAWAGYPARPMVDPQAVRVPVVAVVVGLILGRVPPPGCLRAGAVIGANQSVQYGRLGVDAVTVYVSPTVVSASRPEVK